MGILSIPFKGTVIKVVLAGVVIGGAVYAADKLNLGTRVSDGANQLGQAGGNAITQPIAGLVDSLTKGIRDIQLNTQGLFEGLGSAGADVQEAFTGNRDAIKDFFDGNERQEFRASDIFGSSLEELSKSVTDNFLSQSARTSVRETAESSGSFSNFLTDIAKSFNPEKDTPTAGFYIVTFRDGRESVAIPLSAQAVEQFKDAGNSVRRVG